jgi:hypothetical protein
MWASAAMVLTVVDAILHIDHLDQLSLMADLGKAGIVAAPTLALGRLFAFWKGRSE